MLVEVSPEFGAFYEILSRLTERGRKLRANENARCAGGKGGQLERNTVESVSDSIIQQIEQPAGDETSINKHN